MKRYDGFYFSYSVIPELSANSIAVVKQCSSLSRHAKVLLFGIKSPGYQKHDLKAFYGIDDDFEMVLLPKEVLKFGYLPYAVIALLYYFRYRPSFIYTRDIYLSRIFCWARLDNYYEIHQLDHNQDAFDKRFKRMFITLAANRFLKKVVCISNALKQDCERFGVHSKKLAVLHSASDMIREDALINKPHIGDRPKVIYTGSTQKGKGIEMIGALAKLHPEYDFIVIGGKKEDLGHFFSNNLTHLPWTSPSEVKAHLSRADICLLPNTVQKYKFHSPLKLFDYMALGKAIVASNIVGVNEIIVDQHNGMLVTPGDISGFGAAIRTLLNDTELKFRVEKNALDMARNHTWDKRALSILKLVR